MKITKSQLKQIIKEEYSSLIGEEPLATDDISAGDEPSMSTGWKLDEILKIPFAKMAITTALNITCR